MKRKEEAERNRAAREREREEERKEHEQGGARTQTRRIKHGEETRRNSGVETRRIRAVLLLRALEPNPNGICGSTTDGALLAFPRWHGRDLWLHHRWDLRLEREGEGITDKGLTDGREIKGTVMVL